jgi:hypothetical protein
MGNLVLKWFESGFVDIKETGNNSLLLRVKHPFLLKYLYIQPVEAGCIYFLSISGAAERRQRFWI